jgi:hypothetical protein
MGRMRLVAEKGSSGRYGSNRRSCGRVLKALATRRRRPIGAPFGGEVSHAVVGIERVFFDVSEDHGRLKVAVPLCAAPSPPGPIPTGRRLAPYLVASPACRPGVVPTLYRYGFDGLPVARSSATNRGFNKSQTFHTVPGGSTFTALITQAEGQRPFHRLGCEKLLHCPSLCVRRFTERLGPCGTAVFCFAIAPVQVLVPPASRAPSKKADLGTWEQPHARALRVVCLERLRASKGEVRCLTIQ